MLFGPKFRSIVLLAFILMFGTGETNIGFTVVYVTFLTIPTIVFFLLSNNIYFTICYSTSYLAFIIFLSLNSRYRYCLCSVERVKQALEYLFFENTGYGIQILFLAFLISFTIISCRYKTQTNIN